MNIVAVNKKETLLSLGFDAVQKGVDDDFINVMGIATDAEVRNISGNLQNEITLKLDKTGGVVTSDLTVQGNLVVNGTQFITNTQSVSARDNLIVINAGEVGAGVTAISAGILVDRGSLPKYAFLFDETTDRFKIGTVDNMQPVATREENPLSNGIPIWDSSNNRFKTDSNLNFSGSILYIGGILTVARGAAFGNTAETNVVSVNGINSGTGKGSAFLASLADAPLVAIGNVSACLGGAFDANAMVRLYSSDLIIQSSTAAGTPDANQVRIGGGSLKTDALGVLGNNVTANAMVASLGNPNGAGGIYVYNSNNNRPAGVSTMRKCVEFKSGGTDGFSYDQHLNLYGTARSLNSNNTDGKWEFRLSNGAEPSENPVMGLSSDGVYIPASITIGTSAGGGAIVQFSNTYATGIYGGSTSTNGAGIIVHGDSHSTLPNVIQFRRGAFVLSGEILADGTLNWSGNVVLPSTGNVCLGDPSTDGSWKIVRSGNDLVFQRRESASWVTKSTITA
jgi:hypothetical protein